MNKIIVDKETFELNFDETSDEYIFLDVKCSIINIKVNNNKFNKLVVFVKNNNLKINLEMKDNSHLEINNLGINSCTNYNILIHNECHLILVDSILSKKDSINNLNINNIGKNNYSKIYTNGINLENNKLYFQINGIVSKESKNSILSENSKIINLKDGDSKIIPNLIIDTKEVKADHSAFIGTFTKDELFYLMSRGIKEEFAKNLLIKSVLLKGMELDKEKFIKEIGEYLKIGGDVFE